MIFRNIEGRLERGILTVDHNSNCSGKLALVELIIPNISDKDKPNNALQIICDQLDSCFDNPDRILKRLYFDKLSVSNRNHFWEAKFLEFKELSSSDNFLTFKIQRLNGHAVKFHRNVSDHRVFLTLAIQNEDDSEKKWALV